MAPGAWRGVIPWEARDTTRCHEYPHSSIELNLLLRFFLSENSPRTVPETSRSVGPSVASPVASGGDTRVPVSSVALFLLLAAALLALAACTPGIGGVSSGWNALTVGDDTVYVGTKSGAVQALTDLGDGNFSEKWRYPQSTEGENSLIGVYGAPLMAAGLLFVGAENGYIYALDPQNGSVSDRGWRRPVGLTSNPAPIVAGPVYDSINRRLLVPSEDGTLYSFDAETGEPAWKFDTGDKIWSTPSIGSLDGTPVAYFGSHDGNVYAVNVSDGKEIWRFETGGVVAGKPLLLNDMVIVGSFDKKLYAIDARDGALRWEFEGENWFWAGPVTNGRTVFAPGMDGNLYALDRTGFLEWKFDAGSELVSSPVVVPKGLVVASLDGDLILVDVADGAGQRELHRLTLGDAEIKAPLAAIGSSVYVGSDDGSARRVEVHEQFSEAVLTARACWNHEEACR